MTFIIVIVIVTLIIIIVTIIIITIVIIIVVVVALPSLPNRSYLIVEDLYLYGKNYRYQKFQKQLLLS